MRFQNSLRDKSLLRTFVTVLSTNRPYVFVQHALKIHHQSSFAINFLKLLALLCSFHEVIIFILFFQGNLPTKIFANCILKARLGGEICLSESFTDVGSMFFRRIKMHLKPPELYSSDKFEL